MKLRNDSSLLTCNVDGLGGAADGVRSVADIVSKIFFGHTFEGEEVSMAVSDHSGKGIGGHRDLRAAVVPFHHGIRESMNQTNQLHAIAISSSDNFLEREWNYQQKNEMHCTESVNWGRTISVSEKMYQQDLPSICRVSWEWENDIRMRKILLN